MSLRLRLVRRLGLVAVSAATVAGPVTSAQSPAPRFDAAAVKRNTSGSENGARNLGAGGRLVFTNFTLDRIIAAAYEIEGHQLLSAPQWTATERFDLVATAGANVPIEQLTAMLRTLLVERFKLAVHAEERVMPSYVLTRARGSGRLGPALKPSKADCGPTGRGTGPAPTPGCSAWIGPGTMSVAGQPIAQLARFLGLMLEGPVVDKTGLAGGYDMEMKFSFENLPGVPTGPPGSPGPPIDPNSPTLFAALQEQLGLKLESQRAPVKVIVVDSVSLPTAD